MSEAKCSGPIDDHKPTGLRIRSKEGKIPWHTSISCAGCGREIVARAVSVEIRAGELPRITLEVDSAGEWPIDLLAKYDYVQVLPRAHACAVSGHAPGCQCGTL